jgi:hypothetical protein
MAHNVFVKLGCGGVDLSRLDMRMRPVFKVLSDVWGDEIVLVTSTWEGWHMASSLHYRFRAIDVRPPVVDSQLALEKVRDELGADYDVIDEGSHFHIEYDPSDG